LKENTFLIWKLGKYEKFAKLENFLQKLEKDAKLQNIGQKIIKNWKKINFWFENLNKIGKSCKIGKNVKL